MSFTISIYICYNKDTTYNILTTDTTATTNHLHDKKSCFIQSHYTSISKQYFDILHHYWRNFVYGILQWSITILILIAECCPCTVRVPTLVWPVRIGSRRGCWSGQEGLHCPPWSFTSFLSPHQRPSKNWNFIGSSLSQFPVWDNLFSFVLPVLSTEYWLTRRCIRWK